MAIKFVRFKYDILNYDLLYTPQEEIMEKDEIVPLGTMYRRVYYSRTGANQKMEAFYVRYRNNVYASTQMTEAQFFQKFTGVYESVLTTAFDEPTPSYPVGVFNVNDKYLGIATKNSEYVALWNADMDNSLTGSIADSGTPLKFTITKKKESWDGKLKGYRYYQFDHRGTIFLAAHKSTYIDWGDGVVEPALKYRAMWGRYNNNGNGSYQKSDWDMRTDVLYGSSGEIIEYYADSISNTPDHMTVIRDIGGAYKTIRVFHSERSAVMFADQNNNFGWGMISGMGNVSGNLPLYCDSFFLVGTPMNFTNTNIADLKNIKIWTWSAYAYAVHFGTNLPMAVLTNLQNSCAVIYHGAENNLSLLEFGSKWKNMRSMKAWYINGGVYDGATVPPLLDDYMSIWGSPSTAQRDAFFNNMAAAEIKPNPRGRKYIDYSQGNASSASAASRAKLASWGWYMG